MLLTSLPLAAALAAGAPAPAQGGPRDVVDTLIAKGDFTTLVQAVEAADLVDTLKGPGPLTVFAPTDEAFAKLPPAQLNRLLDPSNQDELITLLTYHVVGDGLLAADVLSSSGAVTLQGQKVDFTATRGGVLIDNSSLVTADVLASNGVIHSVDEILVPEQDDLVQLLSEESTFSTLVAAVEAAGLVDLFTGDDEYTLFAPTDRAFEKLPPGTLEELLKPENLRELVALLENHVVAGRVYSETVVSLDEVTTIGGGTLDVVVGDDGVTVGGATLQAVDVDAENGVVHVVDEVLLPARR